VPAFALGPVSLAAGYSLRAYQSVGSTNAEALAAAENGAPSGTWFAALQQTAGRGRRGRAWSTPFGNLAASLMLRPGVEPARAASLGFVAGVALHHALSDVLGAAMAAQPGAPGRIALKWPNDVLLDRAKLAGILLEARPCRDGTTAIVIGCGVNVVAAPTDLPYAATSTSAVCGFSDAPALFAALTDAWVALYARWDQGRGLADVLAEWRGRAAGLGQPVTVAGPGGAVQGIFDSIDNAGRLVVRLADGTAATITAGDVFLGTSAGIRE